MNTTRQSELAAIMCRGFIVLGVSVTCVFVGKVLLDIRELDKLVPPGVCRCCVFLASSMVTISMTNYRLASKAHNFTDWVTEFCLIIGHVFLVAGWLCPSFFPINASIEAPWYMPWKEDTAAVPDQGFYLLLFPALFLIGLAVSRIMRRHASRENQSIPTPGHGDGSPHPDLA